MYSLPEASVIIKSQSYIATIEPQYRKKIWPFINVLKATEALGYCVHRELESPAVRGPDEHPIGHERFYESSR